MKLTCHNINHGIALIVSRLKYDDDFIYRNSRNGATLSYNEPCMIVFSNPNRCACSVKSRDANPFFHLFESLWMLAGRNDVPFLTLFNKNMANYSDDGAVFNAAYGYRLRRHFGKDQLAAIVEDLRRDNTSRQAVALIWSPDDLGKTTKDKACNLELVFKLTDNILDMTVFNRSNDIVYGTFGANAVHMSMIMMYVCSKLGCRLGKYYQISNCLHAYTEGTEGKILQKLMDDDLTKYEYPLSYITTDYFDGKVDSDISQLFALYDDTELSPTPVRMLYEEYESTLFRNLVIPMLELWIKYKVSGKDAIRLTDYAAIKPLDWRKACETWIENRSR